MNFNFESDIVESNDDIYCISGTEIPVHQILTDISNGSSLTEISEEYEIEESMISQLLIDLSEMLR